MSLKTTKKNEVKENSKILDIKEIISNYIVDIIGQDNAKEQIKSALIANRHILIVGAPGIGKTTIAKNVAKLLKDMAIIDNCPYHCTSDNPICPACKDNVKSGKKLSTTESKGIDRFIRIQGSPDLTVEDIIGDIDPIKAMKFGPLSIEAFSPGKLFKANNGILFFDEINRAPEKLQNSLLQALQERKVTIGSYDVDINVNFILIATMNPQDINTQKLSYVLMDRFDVIYMDYPASSKEEFDIVVKSAKDIIDANSLKDDEKKDNTSLLYHFIEFVRDLRDNDSLANKPSPRASIGLYERAQSNAILNGRRVPDYDDYRKAMISVLLHRIELKPSIKISTDVKQFLEKEFDKFRETHSIQKLKEHYT